MARPKQVPEPPPLTEADIEAATYTGSKEHKVVRWWGGLPGARLGKSGTASRPKKQLTTICNLVTEDDRIRATCWVKEALSSRNFKYFEGDQTYPKHIWHQDETGQRWFGFCVNGVSGEYKGWPLDEVDH